MSYSFLSELVKLRHKRKITAGEYKELVKKLDRHEKEVRENAIEEFVERITLPLTEEDIDRIVEELKGEEYGNK